MRALPLVLTGGALLAVALLGTLLVSWGLRAEDNGLISVLRPEHGLEHQQLLEGGGNDDDDDDDTDTEMMERVDDDGERLSPEDASALRVDDDDEDIDEVSSNDNNNSSSPATDEDEEDQVPFEPAPRTSTVDYNHVELGGKYFVYSASGGLGNQIIEYVSALKICSILNRTLLVPMVGRHTDGWKAHEQLHGRELFPADRVFDFAHMAKYGVPVIPLNVSVSEFVRRFVQRFGEKRMKVDFHTERFYWDETEMKRHYAADRHLLLYVRGAGMFHHWFPARHMAKVNVYWRFNPWLRRAAMDIVQSSFNATGGVYNAYHVRMGDYAKRWGEEPEQRMKAVLYEAVNTGRFESRVPLYVLTEDPSCACLRSLRHRYDVYSIFDLHKTKVKNYIRLFPKGQIRMDMIGILDQLMGVQSARFFGPSWSTFSEYIYFMRRHKDKLFPEVYRNRSVVGGNESLSLPLPPVRGFRLT